MNQKELIELKKLTAQIRIDVIKMLKWRRYGHLGGSLSIAELLSVLYGKYMDIDPKNPHKEDRDYLVLSKGHAGPALYATLANMGYFDKEMLYTLNEIRTNLPSHPDRLRTPGIDATTGSLGQGTSVATGLAYGLRMEKSDKKVYLIVGDGELNEGQVWEAFQFIAHHKLNEVVVFIDNNKMQLDGTTEDILNPFDIKAKLEAFGFYTQEVDGHSEEALVEAIDKANAVKDQAVAIVLDTVKAKGFPYFEENIGNHSPKFNDKVDEEADKIVKELEDFIKENGGLKHV
ncbi:transketolase [uncultured Helcococcus sp.]|uniref:transketolase n=1 Tax=uncultured Helcococcus sp. TaxID=1072508 RepID=UPI00288A6CD5|nr:transketolase [uncultured Helcococcus sp.]